MVADEEVEERPDGGRDTEGKAERGEETAEELMGPQGAPWSVSRSLGQKKKRKEELVATQSGKYCPTHRSRSRLA